MYEVEKLDEFERTFDGEHYYVCAEVIKVVEALNARIRELEETQSKWIDVDERKPTKQDADDDGDVLASSEEYPRGFLCGFDDFNKFNITHWMCLPPSPRNSRPVTERYESRIKDLEHDATIRERDIQRLEKMNVELVSGKNIQLNRIKKLEAENNSLKMANSDLDAHFNTLMEDFKSKDARIKELEASLPTFVSVDMNADRIIDKILYVNKFGDVRELKLKEGDSITNWIPFSPLSSDSEIGKTSDSPIDDGRRRMKEYFSQYTPEEFCNMLESKYGLKENTGRIEIKRNPNGDTRTAPKGITMEQFAEANDSHIQDVRRVMHALSCKMDEQGNRHDFTKKEFEPEFYNDFVATMGGNLNFVDGWWYQKHIHAERHHPLSYCHDDINLIDVLEMVVDCTVAGLARSGDVRPVEVNNEILAKAVANTTAFIKNMVTVKD